MFADRPDGISAYWLGSDGRRLSRPRVRRREEVRDRSKRSMLQLAVENGDEKLLELLLRFESDTYRPDLRGYTAFHSGALFGRTRCLQMLVKHAEKMPEDSEHGEEAVLTYNAILDSSLNIAVEREKAGAIAVLLRAGANPYTLSNPLIFSFPEASLHDPSVKRLLVIAKTISSNCAANWLAPGVRNRFCLTLQWEKLSLLCKNAPDALVNETGLPREVWNMIVMYL